MPSRQSAGTPPVDAGKVRNQLEKILASRQFANSGRMCKFLRFTVERALTGDADSLKEYVIALEVFDRDASYNPRIDSVVRVEARRLRSKLKQFYSNEGRDDTVLIGFREGSYAPAIKFIQASTPSTGAELPVVVQKPHAVAVLPFVNLSPEPDQDFFCDGLTEEIIHGLAAAEDLRVVAHTSAFQFKGKSADVREVAAKLGVDTVIEGSVRKAGKRVRISAEIIDAANGFHLWSGRFDRGLKDVLALQDDVSQRIADTLKIKLPPIGQQAAQRQFPNPEVYSAYLRGRYQANRQCVEGPRRAVELFEQLIRDDPEFALGHAGLAEAYGLLAACGGMPPLEAMAHARVAALNALRLDASLAEPHALIGGLLSFCEWRREEAARHFQRAIELQPGYAMAHHWYGLHLLALGHFEASEAALRRAQALDPLSLHIGTDLATCLFTRRDFEGAIRQFLKTLESEPGHESALFGLARVYCQIGNYEAARAFAQRGHASDPESPTGLGLLGEVLGYAGLETEARQILRQLDELSTRLYVPPLARVFVYASLKEWESTFEWLQRAEQERGTWLSFLKVDPRFDPVRNDHRFQALLGRLNLIS